MILDRLQRYLQYSQISFNKFEISIGVSHGSVSNAWKNKKNIGSNVVANILKTYPELSAEWLLRGEGEMLITLENLNKKRQDAIDSKLNEQLILKTLRFFNLETKSKLEEFYSQASDTDAVLNLEQFVLSTWEKKYGQELKSIRHQLMTIFTDKLDSEKIAIKDDSKTA